MKNLLRVAALVVVGFSSIGAAQAYDWTGFYAGIHGGAGVLKSDTDLDPENGLPDPMHVQGFGYGLLGGGQIGYLHDTGTVVVGVELSGSLGNTSASGTFDTKIGGMPILFDQTVTMGPQGQLVATLGFEPIDGWLFYGGGGVEVAALRLDGTATSSGGVTKYGSSVLSPGITGVVGVRTMIADNASLNLGLNASWHGFNSDVEDPFTPDVHTDTFSVGGRVGLNFHF